MSSTHDDQELARHLDSCQRQLQAASGLSSSVQAVANGIVSRLGSLLNDATCQSIGLAELDKTLVALEEELLGSLRASLSKEDAEGLYNRALEEGKPYSYRLTPEWRKTVAAQHMDKYLHERYALPRFGLFYMRSIPGVVDSSPRAETCPNTASSRSTSDDKITQLPIWPERVRGGPNALLRSAFFAGIHSKKRQTLGSIQRSPDKEPEGVTIAAQDGIFIKYAGTQLNQYDADVFFEALHNARRHPLGAECFFRGSEFLKSINRSDSKLSYEDLDNSLRRLRRGSFDINWAVQDRPLIFSGSLISTYSRETKSRLYKITFAEEILSLFAPASWTQLEWDERKSLMGSPLAQWLHSYFSTHARPYPVSVAFLKEKTGSPTSRLAHFRTEIRNALRSLESQLGWQVEWAGDLITVIRKPSASQARHLEKYADKYPRQRQLGKKPTIAAEPAPLPPLLALT